ncbi:hypothetical protein ACFL2V_11105 [Pseudomonadota bacterium]
MMESTRVISRVEQLRDHEVNCVSKLLRLNPQESFSNAITLATGNLVAPDDITVFQNDFQTRATALLHL